VIISITIFDPQHSVNGQWTAALGAIEGDEPSLTAVAAPYNSEVALVNDTKNCVILFFRKRTLLQQ